MLNTLSRHSHAIAWFFVAVFYLELVLTPVTVRANERPLPYKTPRKAAPIWETTADNREPESKRDIKMPESVNAGLPVKNIKMPAGIKGTFTTGPVQPETQSFQSVNSNNLVDLFTGDFSYNIPLLDVGGYPVSLHYQSGITMDQEASWVGLGWNINPGAITRNMRGLPDDFSSDAVTKTISIKPNKTFGVTVGANAELFGRTKFEKIRINDTTTKDIKGRTGVAGISLGVFHNTYKGWGTEYGLNVNINAGTPAKGPLSAGLGITNNSQNGLDISPSLGLKIGKENKKALGCVSIGTNYNSRVGLQSLQMSGQNRQTINAFKKQATFGLNHDFTLSFAQPSYTPTITVPYTSRMFSFTAKVGSEHWGLHPNFYVRGYGGLQEVEGDDKTVSLPGYGYLNYEKSGSKQNVLLDFNREKDVAYNDNAPHIGIPIYTYDTWSISGEGTGGMFRAYRGDIGYVFDHSMTTKSNSDKLSLDLGFGTYFHGGVDFNGVDAYSKTNPWTGDNNFAAVVPFRSKDTTYENVYFKNPGERTSVNKKYLAAIGNDSLMRVILSGNPENATAMPQVALFKGGKVVGSRTFDGNTVRKDRDKRTQVITYLNAQEAACVGLDKGIMSYNINSFPATSCGNSVQTLPRVDNIHKAYHISELSVLNDDGRRYVYGIPVYNISQTDVTMSTQPGDNTTGFVPYDSTDNSVNNNREKDGYYNRETLPAYAHSFLLSGILSNDYVDLTGDGITQDDIGDAVKFNYSKAYGFETPYRWRAPYDRYMAAYNEGVKTDNRDERGSFTYGKREVWYLNSVESKTMIATFVLETDSIRQDSYGVINENGGQDAGQKLYRLKEINLYAKADYLKYGAAGAKPIKTVHFDYSYELCKNNPGSLSAQGKLTLKRVWFSFNKNEKGRRNPYEFTYHAANPGFSAKSTDRWGNYKNPKGNPGATGQELNNADYPYSLQKDVKGWDSTKAADSSAPWTLTQIKLPSGARLKITYESDDYAYVQNKRAMQFFKVAGFGSSPTDAIKKNLFQPFTAGTDYQYVYINVTETVTNKAEIARKYLEGVNTLYFKLAVNVPSDRWGKGFELIPVYADIEDYGVKTGSSNKTIWVKVKPITGDESPFATAALQFLRLNLPSKAYPFSEPGDNLSFKTLVGMLATIAGNVKNTFSTFNKVARRGNLCNSVDSSISFVRLDNPVYKKLGGGLRVKKVEVYDNFDQMTGHQQQESKYGQTYDYTTETDINGTPTRISSGVATYEPVIGSDENPFRLPQKLYPVKVGALAPADFMYNEEPLGETFFPAPMVGYSKVRVQTIHNDKKSANGFEVTEFYTAKEYPVFVEYTPLDDDSKKSYNPAINNFLSFNAKHYVTLSQGFKVELNDMHGKLKSQATYGQNDLTKPISYTYNYYKLKNENTAQPKLSNTVAVADSATGSIDTAAEIGKDIEIMVDVREETSSTVSKSCEANLDFVNPWPVPITIISSIPLPSRETNRYRAIAILKVVNRYGLLDSIIHIEKGSRVTTRNLLYDGETGDVLLSQTNNEFDDPVYNFSYPAHWAYTGMGPAYKNIGTVLKGVKFHKGIMKAANGQRIATERYFESGDEILAWGNNTNTSGIDDYCDPNYYQFGSDNHYFKIWAVDASKGKEGQKGIYFIDKDGVAVSANTQEIRIIRSGKRNMPGVSVGSITSLKSPIKTVNNLPRLVFDSATHVVAASAGRFKDKWKVDSTLYAKDTTIIAPRKMTLKYATLFSDDNYAIEDYKGPDHGDKRKLGELPTFRYFQASSYDDGYDSWDDHIRSWLRFDLTQHQIPQGALIQSATLYLYGCKNRPQQNYRTSNACYLERLKAAWPRQVIMNTSGDKGNILGKYFWDDYRETTETATRVTIGETEFDSSVFRNAEVDITSMAQAMVDQYYDSKGTVSPAMRISLIDKGDGYNKESKLNYNTRISTEECASEYEDACVPAIMISYYEPCAGGSQPTYATSPDPGYYCYDLPVDTFLCKPNINDTAVNFYRFGVLGNWRMDRAYTYYGSRMQSDPSDTTNIRTDGTIKSFVPFWSFTNSMLTPGTDSSRWVWNSELTAFNNKSNEIENHDPLNRYNAGQYGYNQTLPVAVAQNAQAREIAFDGFEDYGYRTDTCKKCVLNRHVDLGSGATLVDSVSHSGLYSLRLAGNQIVSKIIPIGQPEPAGPEFSMKVDSTPIVKTIVNGHGTGLGNYYLTINSNGCHPYYEGAEAYYTGYNTEVNYNSFIGPFVNACQANNLYYSFKGFIQPRYTGVYKFWVTGREDIGIYIWRNGVKKNITHNTKIEELDHSPNTPYATDTMLLQAGEVYQIEIDWDIFQRDYRINFEWESQGEQSQVREIVPGIQLYPLDSIPASIKNSTIVIDTTWCVKFKNPTATAVTNKRFSPLPGQKVLVSAWVKQDEQCITGNYVSPLLELAFNNEEGQSIFRLKPTGNIIEGWQRIEDTLTIPVHATSVSVNMYAFYSIPVYFDDIRIQPFNANMKTFVYNPINLRLMAELDENNYATFYEYDDDGTLIRVKKETERGVKTVKESRSALLKQ